MPTTEYSQAAITLTEALIRHASVTPQDAGCQNLMMDRLRALGFRCEPMRFGHVDNFGRS